MYCFISSRTKVKLIVEIGSREQGAGSREQGAGSREQGAGSREQGTGSTEQGTQISVTLVKVYYWIEYF
ncbi:MAG: hypothetical protein F6K52_31405 [Moorea sp. SIO3H5]|nr:hypothetical protein [Moorena sp. SIO3H5]